MTDHDNGANGFGDEGHFIPGPADAGPRHSVHWPTVLAACGAAALVAALILAVGVVGMHRSADTVAQPATVRVVTDGVAADAPPPGAAPPGGAPPAPEAGADSAAAGDPAPVGATGGSAEPHAASSSTASAPAAHAPAQGAAPGQNDPAPAPDAATADADGADGPLTAWQPSGALPADFTVTDPDPTLDQLNAIVYFLVANPGSDAAKARNLEAGRAGAIVPKTVYNLGIFRAPRGWSRVTGPVQRGPDRVTAQLHSFSAGMPGVDMPIDFVYRDGNWKLASSSLCAGVKTVGLPIYCNG